MKCRIYSKLNRFYVQYKWGPFWRHFCRSYDGGFYPADFNTQEDAKKYAEYQVDCWIFEKNNRKKIVEEFEL